jgi:hypothetical protein
MKLLIKIKNFMINLYKIWKSLINLDKTVLESSFYLVLAIISLVFFYDLIAMDIFSILIILVASISIYSTYVKNKNPSTGLQKKILDFIIKTEKKSEIRRNFDI